MTEENNTSDSSQDVEQKEFVSKEELLMLAEKRARAQQALLLAQKVMAESQNFELDYRNSILHTFLKYRMSMEDRFDEETGEIFRNESGPSATEKLSQKE